MVMERRLHQVEDAAGGTRFIITGTENDPLYTRMYDRARTHAARLECDIQRRAGKPVVTISSCSRPDRLDLGMRRRVMRPDRTIPSLSQYRVIPHKNCTDRHLVLFFCPLRQADSMLHPFFIMFTQWLHTPARLSREKYFCNFFSTIIFSAVVKAW